MISVTSTLKAYEIDGKTAPIDATPISVKSHWNRDELVVLVIEGKEYTVLAKDLRAAIENGTNVARF